MTLSTHAVIGGLIGAVASHNILLAAGAGFMSHFIFDTIPHWDYSLSSIKSKGRVIENDMNMKSLVFFLDLFKIAFDFCIGMGLVVAAFWHFPSYVLIGAVVGALCAVAPDPLQFVYWKFRYGFMVPLMSFHINFMHAQHDLNDKPILGILSQTALIAVTLLATRLL